MNKSCTWEQARIDEMQNQINELKAWKESALTQLNSIRLQEIGGAMGLRVGEDIGPKVLPYILELQKRMETIHDLVQTTLVKMRG